MVLPELTLYLYPHEVASMSEYSSTMPTGVVPGKVWRRNLNDGTSSPPEWVVCMYSEFFTRNGREYAKCITFAVVYRQGPEPRNYEPPDWDNYNRWREMNDDER
jgi:hypothetical protein